MRRGMILSPARDLSAHVVVVTLASDRRRRSVPVITLSRRTLLALGSRLWSSIGTSRSPLQRSLIFDHHPTWPKGGLTTPLSVGSDRVGISGIRGCRVLFTLRTCRRRAALRKSRIAESTRRTFRVQDRNDRREICEDQTNSSFRRAKPPNVRAAQTHLRPRQKPKSGSRAADAPAVCESRGRRSRPAVAAVAEPGYRVPQGFRDRQIGDCRFGKAGGSSGKQVHL
jgi:hypothetical protein